MSGNIVHIRSASHVLRVGLRDGLLDLPKLSNGLAERLTLLAVVTHHLNAASGNAQRHRRQGDALDLEVAHHAQRGAADLTNHVGRGHLDVVEDQLCGHRGTHAALVLNLLAQREARHALLHNERGQTLAGVVAGARIHQEDVAGLLAGDGSVGDPHLSTVDDEVRAVGSLGGTGSHAHHVSAHAGLRHTHTTNLLATAGTRQILGLLLSGTVAGKVVHEKHGVGQVGEAERRVRSSQLLYILSEGINLGKKGCMYVCIRWAIYNPYREQ